MCAKETGSKLLNYNRVGSISEALDKILGDGVNVTRLRQSYISNYFETHPNPTEEECISLGKSMGHGVSTQSGYRKMFEDENEDEENESDTAVATDKMKEILNSTKDQLMSPLYEKK